MSKYNHDVNPRKEGNTRLVSVRIDESVFEKINTFALEWDQPFVSTLRYFIEKGLR